MENHLRKVFLGITAAIVVLLYSCSSVLKFNRSPVVPAATGNVKIKEDKNDNYSIRVKVSNLAPPNFLQPPMSHYVLWMDTQSNPVQNLGQLKSTSPLFVKSLKASLKTVTTYRPTRFFITAENETDLVSPRGQTLLSTDTYEEKQQ